MISSHTESRLRLIITLTGVYGEAEFIFAQVLILHLEWPAFDAQYIAPSKLSLSPVLSFWELSLTLAASLPRIILLILVSFLLWSILKADQIMIESDFAIGKTPDHLFNSMASQARKAGFWAGGLS